MLAQWLVEHVTDSKLEDLTKEMIFEPLQMKNTDYLWREEFKAHFCYGHSTNQAKLPKDIETDDAAAAGSLETTIIDYTLFLQHVLKLYSEESAITKNLFKPSIRIHSKAQFGPLANELSNENDGIELSYGLGWAVFKTPFGLGAGRGGHSEGFQHYSVIFPDQGIGVVLMSNSDNAESIYKELLEITIADTYSPWQWKGYIPYNNRE
ncbi:MAG: serine hydrolase domain-containing protein, partial [Bacteroidota bacterium]